MQISERFFILIMWNNTDTALAYLITFRSYGTWLHGDNRGSVDRFHNRFGEPYLPTNNAWKHHNHKQLKKIPLSSEQEREDRLRKQFARHVAFENGISMLLMYERTMYMRL
jgi:hypothetical protein